jgi:hypothetical protein
MELCVGGLLCPRKIICCKYERETDVVEMKVDDDKKRCRRCCRLLVVALDHHLFFDQRAV